MARIVVIGSINTDMVVRSSQIPGPGQTLMGHSFMTTGGGKGANQAVAAARLGADVSLIAKVGTDTFGKMAIENFKKEKISTENIYIDSLAPSGVAFIVVDDKGENIIIVAPGANSTLNEKDIQDAEVLIGNADIILFQLEIPMTTVAEGVRLAKKHNRLVMLNPAPATQIPEEILPLIDIITPNQTEALMLTGFAVNDTSTAQNACDVLHGKGILTVIITMGEQGAYISSKNYKGLVPGFNAGVTVDTVAAGDTFCGGLAIAIAEGKSLQDAVQFANAAAALSVTKPGAQDSIPTRAEVETLLKCASHM
ncbi:MAG: ribokinase [Chitinophagales bacterium]